MTSIHFDLATWYNTEHHAGQSSVKMWLKPLQTKINWESGLRPRCSSVWVEKNSKPVSRWPSRTTKPVNVQETWKQHSPGKKPITLLITNLRTYLSRSSSQHTYSRMKRVAENSVPIGSKEPTTKNGRCLNCVHRFVHQFHPTKWESHHPELSLSANPSHEILKKIHKRKKTGQEMRNDGIASEYVVARNVSIRCVSVSDGGRRSNNDGHNDPIRQHNTLFLFRFSADYTDISCLHTNL